MDHVLLRRDRQDRFAVLRAVAGVRLREKTTVTETWRNWEELTGLDGSTGASENALPCRELDDPDWSWWAWFDGRYGKSGRAPTMRRVLWGLLGVPASRRTIVETGCQRQLDDIGAGESTRIFSSFCAAHGGRLWSIDIDEQHIEIAKIACGRCVGTVSFFLADGAEFLSGFYGNIDLLYLDSLDYIEGLYDQSQKQCLAELKTAFNKLSPTALVLVDDLNLPGGGKPLLARKFLLDERRGWHDLTAIGSQQALFERRALPLYQYRLYDLKTTSSSQGDRGDKCASTVSNHCCLSFRRRCRLSSRLRAIYLFFLMLRHSLGKVIDVMRFIPALFSISRTSLFFV